MTDNKKPAGGRAGDRLAAGHGSKFSAKSTASEAQRDRILKALELRPHSSYELRKMGCYQAPTRIIELRRRGFNITTERISIWDDEGYRHDGIALYTLGSRA